MKPIFQLVAIGLVFSLSSLAQTPPHANALPLSTKSGRVLRLLDQAWILEADQVEQAKAIEVMHRVVQIDPNFAMGHQILAQISLDPAEQLREQARASATKSQASPAEQGVVDWFQNAADHKLMAAITDMNEALRQYPHDRWLVFLATSWLMAQTQNERAAAVYESSGITNSPGLINNAAYAYANLREYNKAFPLMDRYVSMMPHDANPQDSYGDTLASAGYFNAAIDHYRAALAINPNFYSSEFGIAETHLLMGEESRARQEYESAFEKFRSLPQLDIIRYRTREAITYVYEGDFPGADRAFQALADYAHQHDMSQAEADSYRQMAVYQPRSEPALAFLIKAEAALGNGNNTSALGIHQQEAQILRARVELALRAGDSKTADSALAELATLSESSIDKVIDSAYQGAAGALLYYGRRYREAIPHLEQDSDSPFSLERLAAAYQITGYLSGARHTEQILAKFNQPTVEQALVVPAFRKCLEQPSCDASMKNASLTR
jgi:tetratricopeptide (TPR) repeat protein